MLNDSSDKHLLLGEKRAEQPDHVLMHFVGKPDACDQWLLKTSWRISHLDGGAEIDFVACPPAEDCAKLASDRMTRGDRASLRALQKQRAAGAPCECAVCA
uniref:Uncharacterized protein n=1 Tax=Marseillevirus LCMAC103 TaxID=2506604 RepID=A0A481YUG8_9VIRU|nr:MAG: hypothetical protein LCMAC103_02950 [Marseillevirus LCMAC103]